MVEIPKIEDLPIYTEDRFESLFNNIDEILGEYGGVVLRTDNAPDCVLLSVEVFEALNGIIKE